MLSRKDLLDIVSPYDRLRLECDGLTRVLDYVLQQKGCKHRMMTGHIVQSKTALLDRNKRDIKSLAD